MAWGALTCEEEETLLATGFKDAWLSLFFTKVDFFAKFLKVKLHVLLTTEM